MTISRRKFLQRSGIGLLAFSVAGCQQEMTPQEARDRRVPMQILTATEVDAIERLGDALVPGSARQGLAHYLDHQLNSPPEESMLMIKYLGVPQPFAPFYQAGLAAAAALAVAMFATDLDMLSEQQASELVGKIAAGDVVDWNGPPAQFFYFVLRGDAIDVVYGTERGFEELGIPYEAHILPPSRWGE